MKRKVIIVIAAILVIVLPIAAVLGVAFLWNPQFDNLFTAAVCDKIERMENIDGPKAIIVGGSSTAFGLRSDLLEEEIGMPVVNLGVYASLGTKLMLDISREYVGEGDVVVIAPELDAQTYSLYFSMYDTLQGFDGNFKYLRLVADENKSDLAGTIWKFAASKFSYIIKGKPDPAGVYNRSSFNEYGDISYPRPYNVMMLGYDTDNVISFDYESIVSNEFVTYVLAYAEDCAKKGATVYFSFAPMNSLALAESTTQKDMYDFYTKLAAAFSPDDGGDPVIKVISVPNAYVYDSAYFYDTNTHLNDAGAILRTARLASDMKRQMGISTPLGITIPPKPEKPAEHQGEEWITEGQTDPELFVLEDYGDIYAVIGSKDAAKDLTEIVVPTYYSGKRIAVIGKGAFAGCEKLETVTVPSGIMQIAGGAFEGCPSLKRIRLLTQSADALNVGDELLDGAPDDCVIILVNAKISDFNNHYYWSKYAHRMKEEK